MASYNVYIEIFATEKEIFFVKLQKIEFFSKDSRAITKMGNDFAWEVKEIDNYQIAGWGKDKIDNLGRPMYDHNVMHQDNKTSQKAAFKTVRSK